MSIAPTLQRHLDSNVMYEVITHEPTMSSTRTAQACHVSGNRLAKGVVLRRNGSFVLAVIPASHHLDLTEVSMELGEEVALADEEDTRRLFRDCAIGAIPPVGECYGLDVMVDESIEKQPEVYLEGGDHATLIRMSQTQFTRLMAEARHGRFSTHD